MLLAASFGQMVKFSAKNIRKHRNNEEIQNSGQNMQCQALYSRELRMAIFTFCPALYGHRKFDKNYNNKIIYPVERRTTATATKCAFKCAAKPHVDTAAKPKKFMRGGRKSSQNRN